MTVPDPVTLYIADPADPTAQTRLVDLNGDNPGAASLSLIDEDFDLGVIATEAQWLNTFPVPGDIQVTHRHPRTTMSFRLYAHDTTAKMTETLRRLQLALDAGGVIVFRESSSSTRYYLDFYPSPLPEFYRGQERTLWKILGLLMDPDGLPIQVWRHPYLRMAQLDAAVNLLSNSLLMEDADGDGIPDGWTWDSLTGLTVHTINWHVVGLGANYSLIAAASGTRTLQQVVASGPGDILTLSFDAAGTTASGSITPQARAVVEFLDASNSVLATATGTAVTTLSSLGWTRVSVTTTSAPSLTTQARVGLQLVSNAANSHNRYLRNAQLERASAATPFRAGPTLVTNDITATHGMRMWAWNPANAAALAQFRATPDAGANTITLDLSRRSGSRDSAEFGNLASGFLVKDADSLFNGTIQPAIDLTATTGVCAETPSGSLTATLKKRWRREYLPTNPTALEGRFRLFIAVKAPINTVHRLQLRWGIGDVDDLPYVVTLKDPLDTSDAATPEFEWLELGSVSLEKGTDGLFLEGWLARDSGSGNFRWDAVKLLPADESFTSIVIPGRQAPVLTETDTWLGSDLVVPTDPPDPGAYDPGQISGTSMILRPSTTANLQAAGTPPNTGFVLDAEVEHTVTATLSIFDDAATGQNQGSLRVWDLTAGAEVVGARSRIAGTKGIRWTQKVVTVRFTPVAGNAYQYYVVYTATWVVGQGNITVVKMGDTFTPPVTGFPSQDIALDGDTRRIYTREGEMFARPLTTSEGGFLELAPGVNLLTVATGDSPSVGHANAKHVPTRTALCVVNLIPRSL